MATQGHKHITKRVKQKTQGDKQNTIEGDRIYSRTRTQPNQNRMTLTELVKSVWDKIFSTVLTGMCHSGEGGSPRAPPSWCALSTSLSNLSIATVSIQERQHLDSFFTRHTFIIIFKSNQIPIKFYFNYRPTLIKTL